MDFRHTLNLGQVIPAHPLALNAQRKLDERRQRALARYYIAAGSGGLAVGVHTTQFEIREPKYGLYEPVLKLARRFLCTVPRAESASQRCNGQKTPDSKLSVPRVQTKGSSLSNNKVLTQCSITPMKIISARFASSPEARESMSSSRCSPT